MSDNVNNDAENKIAKNTLILVAIGFAMDVLLFAIVTMFTRVTETGSSLAVAALAVRQVEPSNQVAVELAAANHMAFFPSFMGLMVFAVLSILLWSVIITKIVKNQQAEK